MKICFVHEEYPDETNFGGIATYQKIVAEQLAKEGNLVYVICRGLYNDSSYVENGVNIIRLFSPCNLSLTKQSLIYRRKVANVLRKLQYENKIEIIETPDWGANTVLFEKYRKIPLVVRLHTPLKIWLKYNRNDFGNVSKKMLKWEKYMLNRADYITSCSTILKNMVVKEYDIKNKEIYVIPNPANLNDFYYDKSIEKKEQLIFVGSLEERKGVIVLAKALNIIFDKFPNLKIEFVGKDTKRNHKNISTKQLILNIVREKFHKNIIFTGQLKNTELNNHFNQSSVAVFPSLFDNCPYVVLEAMATGIQIVGSRNSGMIDMLSDDTAIYDTGDYIDLAQKIVFKYKKSLNQKVNYKHIKRVNLLYDASKICKEMLLIYSKVIDDYRQFNTNNEELEQVLSNVVNDTHITKFSRERGGVSNYVFKVYTAHKIFIIKKYIYDYNFKLAQKLYELYEKEKLDFVKPLNNEIISLNDINYNVFEYKKRCMLKRRIPIQYISKLLSCNRMTNIHETIVSKCDKYYLYLRKVKDSELINDINYVIKKYDELRNKKILKEQYLNHGDISKSNIIHSRGNCFIIDFDEVTVTTSLYDFAVVIIKMCIGKNKKIDFRKYDILKNNMKEVYSQYDDNDFSDIVRFYLCKILLEKFYLHKIKKINLFSKRQLKDSYIYYMRLLKSFDDFIR